MARIITKAEEAKYVSWWSLAMRDETVWPYLSTDAWAKAQTIEDSDWDKVVVMDEGNHGVMVFTPSRTGKFQSAGVAVWVLDCPGKLLVAATLMREAPYLARRYGVRFLDACAHASNEASNSLLRKHFGQPWGVKRLGAWNGLTGEFEDKLHYRADLQEQAIVVRLEKAAA